MGINLDLYRKAVTSKDRVFTGKCDINGRKINVGDVIVPVGSTEQYCVNYSPTGRCFYGLGIGNKILKQKKFSQCENVGIAIFNEDAKRFLSRKLQLKNYFIWSLAKDKRIEDNNMLTIGNATITMVFRDR